MNDHVKNGGVVIATNDYKTGDDPDEAKLHQISFDYNRQGCQEDLRRLGNSEDYIVQQYAM